MTNKEIVEKNADENVIRRTVENFNSAFNRHDVDAVMNLMTENCIFSNGNYGISYVLLPHRFGICIR